ncbi:aminomethyltransferase [Iodidimonas muriae]|uniref:aminomethyltransferase n=1 Tax=Iodidimonas muriae TaxID=261467 RepID=A0ABQ2LD48_9PROT|nr:glycine cleavage system aminomethyltransferase GcvT [Iodidimonas muriae]GER07242.1 aminomethyltransferase [Kordiimonadales bacterium JCM 17843]GGO11331.1 aminomethyltransferase [Iodidimonas muriae]
MTDAPKPDTAPTTAATKTTALHSLHLELGGKMVPFAGYDMPVHYPSGIMAEHLHTREKAGLFDVSHMGQAYLTSLQGSTDVAVALESLVPGILATLKPGAMRYTLLLNDEGGILDDLMVTRRKDGEDGLFLVVNAGPKDSDFAHISKKLEGRAQLQRLDGRALLALQGPKAATVLADIAPDCAALSFMEALWTEIDGIPTIISRSGYTGEDGFEISIPAEHAERFARRLLAYEDVAPIGLGARDSLRLEAGLCLYGHDIDTATTPVEAALKWAVPKARRERADFPGAAKILQQFTDGTDRVRVGIRPKDRTIAREGTPITTADGTRTIGALTSGGFGPTLGGPVAMGYVESAFQAPGTDLGLLVRGKVRPASVQALPFVTQNYVRKTAKTKG